MKLKKYFQQFLGVTLIFVLSFSSMVVFANDKLINTTININGINCIINQSIQSDNSIVTTVYSEENNEYSKIVRKGNMLYFEESLNGSSLARSNNSKVINLDNLKDTTIVASEETPMLYATSSQSSTFWGYYAYYNTDPSGNDDVYWSVRHAEKNPGNMYYYANYGTSLNSYSEGYYDDVVSITANQNTAVATVGLATAATIASAIAATNPITTVAGIAGVIASLGIGAVGTAGFFCAAWISAQNANSKYDRIISLH